MSDCPADAKRSRSPHGQFGAVSDFADLNFIVYMAGGRGDRSAALEPGSIADYRFVAHAGLVRHPSHALEKDPQGVGTALVHEGAGHDHVIHEMADEEPVVGADVRFGPDQAQAIAPTLGIELNDAVDQAHAAIGQMQRRRQVDVGKPSAETAG